LLNFDVLSSLIVFKVLVVYWVTGLNPGRIIDDVIRALSYYKWWCQEVIRW